MSTALFQGSGVALVTPFDGMGVNERVLRELIEYQIEGGSDALVMCGSTGEASTMSAIEHARAIGIATETVSGRVPVVAGVGGADSRVVAELARGARDAGADALLISPPPYNRPTQQGIIAHFRLILDTADLPAIVYNIPTRTACNLLPESIEILAEDERIVGVKEASGDISQVAELARRLDGRVAIYSGNDDQVLPFLALGGVGVISVLANLLPGEVSRMVHRFLEGDISGAREDQLRFLPLIQALFAEPNPIPVKAALEGLGFAVGDVRLPLLPASEETRLMLRERMGKAASVDLRWAS